MRKASHEVPGPQIGRGSAPAPAHRLESLEVRQLLSVALDLSLQDAMWLTPTAKTTSATMVSFRVDAVRFLGPAVDPYRIDGVGASKLAVDDGPVQRIDGVIPPGALATSDDALVFSQIDLAANRPFDRDPSTQVDVKSKDGGTASTAGSESAPAVDWSRFELFEDVRFTLTGNQIHAGLPTAGGIVSVNIVLRQFPPGATPSGTFRTGTGDFLARFGALSEIPPKPEAPTEQPSGNDALGIGDDAAEGSPAAPTSPVAPTPPQSSSDQPQGRPTDRGDVPAAADAPAVNQASRVLTSRVLTSARSGSITLTSSGNVSGRLNDAQGIHVVNFAREVATAAAGAGSAPAVAPSADAGTMVLPEMTVASDDKNGWAQSVLFAAGMQLSVLSDVVQRVFGGGAASAADQPPAVTEESFFSHAPGPFSLLGPSTWQIAVQQPEGISTLWKSTAGISLVVAVSGYWYCKEYGSRRRQQEQPVRSPATEDLRRGRGWPSSRRDPLTSDGRAGELIARLSRYWRDETTE